MARQYSKDRRSGARRHVLGDTAPGIAWVWCSFCKCKLFYGPDEEQPESCRLCGSELPKKFTVSELDFTFRNLKRKTRTKNLDKFIRGSPEWGPGEGTAQGHTPESKQKSNKRHK